MIILIYYIISSLIIAHFLGNDREIGFTKSLLFCLFLSPLLGVIITLNYKTKKELIKNEIIINYLNMLYKREVNDQFNK